MGIQIDRFAEIADDSPKGYCMANAGYNDCDKWPDRYPSPCCWLSCRETCGAACWEFDESRLGRGCEHYREEIFGAG